MIRVIHKAADGRIDHPEYDRLAEWWKKRGAAPPPRNILPTLGVVASRNPEGPLAAAAFAYLDATGSGVAWLGWMVTDPDAPPIAAGRALHEAIAFLEREASALGYWLMWSTVAKPSFIKLFQSRDYVATDHGLCHLFRPLPPEAPLT